MAEFVRAAPSGGGEYVKGMPAEGSAGDRIANLAVTVIPLLMVAFAVWEAWGGALQWQYVLIFFITLVPFGFGITVGYHRLFTHRSFQTGPIMTHVLGALGSMAVEGPVMDWVGVHRSHHHPLGLACGQTAAEAGAWRHAWRQQHGCLGGWPARRDHHRGRTCLALLRS